MMSTNQRILERRLRLYSCLLRFYVTPLFQKKLTAATKHVLDALKASESDGYMGNLNMMHGSITLHWKTFFSDMEEAGDRRARMMTIQTILISKLEEDYLGRPYIPNWSVLILATAVRRRAAEQTVLFDDSIEMRDRATSANETECQVGFGQPVRELTIDAEHAKRRLCLLADRSGESINEVQALIETCDWPGLAYMLIYDRKLIEKLVLDGAISRDLENSINQSILKIAKHYFDSLDSATNFVVSKSARKQEKRRNSSNASSSFLGKLAMATSGSSADLLKKQEEPHTSRQMGAKNSLSRIISRLPGKLKVVHQEYVEPEIEEDLESIQSLSEDGGETLQCELRQWNFPPPSDE